MTPPVIETDDSRNPLKLSLLSLECNMPLIAVTPIEPDEQFSPGGTAASSLGREPQGNGSITLSRAPEGRQNEMPSSLCRPSGAQRDDSNRFPGAYAPGYSLQPLRGYDKDQQYSNRFLELTSPGYSLPPLRG